MIEINLLPVATHWDCKQDIADGNFENNYLAENVCSNPYFEFLKSRANFEDSHHLKFCLLRSNEINPQKQPNHYQLNAIYGLVHYPEKAKALKFANQWNEIDAYFNSQAFLTQEESFYDLDKKYIW